MPDNPFEVLRLDPAATEEEVVRQAGQLRQRTAGEEALTALRQAVRALTADAEERLLHSLLTPPRPRYSWPALERLAAAFRRPPGGADCPSAPPLVLAEIDLREFAELVRPLLLRELAPAPIPFETPPVEETAEEVYRQTVEGLWQVLPFDPQG